MENPELICETIDALENGTGGSTGCVTDIVTCHNQMKYMSDQTGLSAEEIEEIINPGGGFNPLCDCTEDPESGSFEACVEERVCEEVNDRVEPHPNIANCPAINCVLNDIIFNSDGTNKFCMDYGALIDDQDWNVIVSSPETYFGFSGETEVDYVSREITVLINRGECGEFGDDDIDYLDLASTLYHEMQHAKFYWDVINDPGFDVSNESEYWQAWQDYARDELGIAYRNHHQAMLEDYIRREAEFLWELNGRKLTVEHYLYSVYEGVKDQVDVDLKLDSNIVDDWKDLHDILQGQEDNYRCDE